MIKKNDIQDIYFLSPMQEGMLFHYLMDKSSPAYFEQTTYRIEGDFDLKTFEQAFNRLIQRYDILRTLFIFDKVKKPVQVVLKKREAQVDYRDISTLPQEEQAAYIENFKSEDKKRGFDLTAEISSRFSVLKIHRDVYEITWSFHHIIMDGWCTVVLLKELLAVYMAIKKAAPINLPAVRPYSIYIKWLEAQDKEKGIRYWKEYLEGFSQRSLMPRRPEAAEDRSQQERFVFKIDRELTGRLKVMMNELQVTPGTLFQVLWGVLLQQYNNTYDVLFGSVVSGRPVEIPGIETMVGLFINTIPLRIKGSPGTTFAELLKGTQQEVIRSRNYEHIPLAEIQAGTSLKRDLFEHIVAFENYPVDSELKTINKKSDLGFTVLGSELFEQTNFDMSIVVAPGKEWAVLVYYNPFVYDPEVIKKIETHLTNIVRRVTGDQNIPLCEIDMLSQAEKKYFVYEINETQADYPADKTIYRLFEEQVEQFPSRVALIDADEHLTYRELHNRALQLAKRLRGKGAGPDDIIGIMAERSIFLVSAMLGILKAGAAYLPIDIDYPRDRKEYILADSRAALLLTPPGLAPGIDWPGEIMEIGESACGDEEAGSVHPDNISKPWHLAYVIYTSGSTGRPKGVMIENRGLVNYVCWAGKTYVKNEKVSFPLYTSISFDLTVTSIFVPLTTGNRVVIYRREEDELVIERIIAEKRVNMVKLTPSHLNVIINSKENTPGTPGDVVKGFIVGGEELKVQLAAQIHDSFAGKVEIFNEYGPTETVVGCMIYKYNYRGDNGISVPIGTAAANVQVYVLDRSRKNTPAGCTGELFISGDGLARGYLNRVELTAAKFIPNPFRPGASMYSSGDLVRRSTDGNLEFTGRIDQQVKIRGYRIELGEIENHLLSHPEIKDACVILKERDAGDKLLCTYAVAERTRSHRGGEAGAEEKGAGTADNLDIPAIKQYLSARLPDYMLPAFIIELEQIPLTNNGKVDREALPEPGGMLAAGVKYEAPANEVEASIVELWEDILKISAPGVNDRFFELGGHSLKAIELAARIYKGFDVKIPLKEVFRRPTVKELAAYISSRNKEESIYAAIEPVEKKEYYVPAPAQKRLYFIQQMTPGTTAYNITFLYIIEEEADRRKLENAFLEMISRHETLRTSFVSAGGSPVQRVHEEVDFAIEYYEGAAPAHSEKEIITNFVKPFDLSAAPLLRVGLAKLAEERYLLMIDIHHIVSDGVSEAICIEEFTALYSGEKLPPLRLQYRDYALWQDREAQKETVQKHREYWLEIYSRQVPPLNMPVDFDKQDPLGFSGSRIYFEIDKETTKALQEIALAEGSTLYMVLLGVYYVLLNKLTGQEDIVVLTSTAGRRHPDLDSILGMFVNTLALRNFPGAGIAFRVFLKELTERTIDMFENQDYPFEDLLEKVPSLRDIMKVGFAFRNIDEATAAESFKLALKRFPYENKTTKVDLYLSGEFVKDRVGFTFIYSTQLFKEEKIKRFIKYFNDIISIVQQDREIKLEKIKISHDLIKPGSTALQEDQGDFVF
ncbi:MAG: amino acid adenylation domain-containing protein [Candidatus Aminicenantes bacterium]|nr:amino acid adenylation domain-containing protein [Candidatus Aminicenantes bacterium]